MRAISTILWSSSAIALMLGAPSAAAQTQPATPPDPTVQAQEQPADPEAGSPQTDDAVQTVADQDQSGVVEEEIVVTGLRRSLQSAQNIKRNSEQIVDAIVAEDIGKLPDVSASATLARVTGVQVTRAAAEAAEVQIRGLPDISTTYNGREIFTAENRFVAIQDFPAGGVAALEVFKSGTANLIEGGLGGQVNVRGRRPFDFRGQELSGSFNIVKFEQSGDWDWNGNLLYSNRWDVGDGGEIGFLINGSMSNIDFLDSTREQAEFIQYWVPVDGAAAGTYREAIFDPGAGINERVRSDVLRAPDASAIFLGRGDRRRPSVNAAFQYRANPDLQFYVDGLFQGYRGNDNNLYFRVPLYCQPILTNVVVQEGTNQMESATGTGGCELFGFNELRKVRTNTYQVGGGVIYDATADLRVTADLAYTDSTFTESQANLDLGSFGAPVRNVFFARPGSPGGPSFDLVDFDTQDPTQYRFGGLFHRKRRATGDDIQGRVDFEWDTGWANVPRLQFGLRHNNRDARQRNLGDFRGSPPDTSYAELPIEARLRECGFVFDNSQPERCFVGFSFNDVFDNLDELKDFVNFPDLDWNPFDEFRGNEKATAGYAQLRYEFDAGVPIDGNIGLRAVRTRTEIEGTRRDDETGEVFPIAQTNTYTDYLPNISTRVRFQDNLQLRLAYTETRTRPSFSDLSPTAIISSAPPVCDTDPTSSGCFRTARSGNPELDPINSKNFDATLEYYFSRTGSASIAVFHRKVSDFIFRDVTEVTDPEFGRIRFDRPENAGDGKIKGLEIQGQTFFDYDFLPAWARGFGVQANYTYLDASTELSPAFRTRLPGQQGFPNVSKHAYNLVGMYEQGPVSARLAYNFRSKFIREYLDLDGFLAPRVEDGHGVLDFSASYTPFENVTFAFDALNILAGDPIRTYREYNDAGDVFDFQRRYLERVFSFGVRFRLGGGSQPAAPAPAVAPPPPPPPVVQPAPVVEEPAPPPPPPPTPERG
jgi:TonB-dependent receptor